MRNKDVEILINKIRNNEFARPTSGYAVDNVQANVVILEEKYALDFLVFCVRNPKSCPLLSISDPGSPYVQALFSSTFDIRTDVPKYHIYRNGKIAESPLDIKNLWKDDFVVFLLGCSFTFEGALMANNIRIKHIEKGLNVAMYQTNIDCVPSGIFSGKMVVSMRAFPHSVIPRVVEITSRYTQAHGSPIHIGDPGIIGIEDICKPDYGDAIEISSDEVPVFWGCGVTPQSAVLNSKPEMMITHAPGHMLITDLPNTAVSI